MADLFFGREWPEVDWKKGLKRKYDIKETEAGAARMRAEAFRTQVATEASTAEKRFGHGSRTYGGLAGEELARRFPYGVPQMGAEAERQKAAVAARGMGLAEKESEYWMAEGRKQAAARRTPEARISGIRGMLEEEEGEVAAPLGAKKKCPPGHILKKGKCIPIGFDIGAGL